MTSRGERVFRFLSWTVELLSIVSLVPSLVYGTRNTRIMMGGSIGGVEVPFLPILTLAFVIVGALVLRLRPRNAVAWGMTGIGASICLSTAAAAFAGWAQLVGESGLLVSMAMVIARALFVFPLALVPLIVVRLPSGETVDRAGRWLSRSAIVLGLLLVGWWIVGSDGIAIPSGAEGPSLPKLGNTFDLFHLDQQAASQVSSYFAWPLVACWLIAGYGLVRRVRRGTPETRAQGRWILLGSLALPLGFAAAAIIDAALPGENDWLWLTAFALGALAAPVAIGVAVARYRLYEIDRVVSRTVSYAVVLGLLAGLFIAVVTLPTALVGGEEAPSWVVATSTLAVAGLFNPLRRRVQRGVDHRFNRSRYDAQLVVERFGDAVRDATDLGEISGSLGRVALEAFQPSGVGVWVREVEA